MKKACIFLLLGLIILTAAEGQVFGSTSTTTSDSSTQYSWGATSTGNASNLSNQLPRISNTAMLAMSEPDYQVTPGDVYALSFSRGFQQESLSLLVQGDLSINASFLGEIDGTDLKFIDLKELLIKKISAMYTNSNPSLVIVSTGVFPVKIKGEVQALTIESAWGLSRLSYVVKPYLTAFSSLRTIKIISKDGVEKEYDLFKADRFGDVSQNPILKPGDVIEVKRANRIVNVTGAVRKPGSYELLPREGIKELIEIYGEGTLTNAKRSTVIVSHKANAERPEGESLIVSLDESDPKGGSLPIVLDGDTVKVTSLEESLPVVYIEGAIQSGSVIVQASQGAPAASSSEGLKTASATAETSFTASPALGDAYGIVRAVLRDGQSVIQLLNPLKGQISNRADLKRGYIVRGTERIFIDIEVLVYQNDVSKDVKLQPNDRIVIPYGYDSVYVKGEVKSAHSFELKSQLRLSVVLKDNLTAFSSIRNIKVTSEDGKVAEYDLFKSDRFGDVSQNPILRPGDVVEVKKASRIVEVQGEVKRPGLYQLLETEGIQELVDYYGDGARVTANLETAVLTRPASSATPDGETQVVDLNAKSIPVLSHGDTLRIPSREENLPIIYIEGAIAADSESSGTNAVSANQGPDSYNIRRLVYRKGELLSKVVKSLEKNISPRADLRNAYVARGSERLNKDLESLIYFYNEKEDIELQPNDKIVIPFGRITARIFGELKESKTFDVIPGLRLSDLLKDNLTVLSSIRDITVINDDGKKNTFDFFLVERKGDLSQNPLLRPGDVIEVKKVDRIVKIEGEVRKPGSYQILPGEGIKELISFYADELLPTAKLDALVITRKASASSPDSESIVFDYSAGIFPEIIDGDLLQVQSREAYLPIVYIEGAIAQDQVSGAQEYGIRRSPLRKGQTVSQIIKPLEAKLLAKADLRNAYIARGTARISINLEKLLHFYNSSEDVVLEPEDHIVIPFGLTYAYIKGEVVKSQAVEVTSQSRLSDLLKDLTTEYSSLRDIVVTSLDGSTNSYDVFKADRFGDLSQNPYIRPGDQIQVNKTTRRITIEGEVARPGVYQLLAQEGAKELVEYYAVGLKPGAKSDSLMLTRQASAEKPESETLVFDIAGNTHPALNDGDVVKVVSRDEYLPIVYLEGALLDEKNSSAYGIQRAAYRSGILVSQVVRPHIAKLSLDADLKNAYIARGTSRLQFDLEKLLFFYDPENDIELKPEDHIVIPFGFSTATIKGEVTQATIVRITAGLRLGDAVKPSLNAYSSIRDIQVSSADGKKAVYDLFKADRFGDIKQNPLLRPGDMIEVAKARRIVQIEGQVAKPGSYQLLDSEGLLELVDQYADKVLADARTDAILITRKANFDKPEGQSIIVDFASKTYPVLLDGDSIKVSSREEYLPVIYIEGAISGDAVVAGTAVGNNSDLSKAVAVGGTDSSSSGSMGSIASSPASGAASSQYSIVRVPYRQGITLSLLLRPLREKISASADMANAFLLRKGSEEKVIVNLEKLLYLNDASLDLEMKPEDRLVIPYGSMNVFVTGEVAKSSWVGITGLTRLRDVVTPLLTRYSSIRDVVVKTKNGSEKRYDLFKADRYGDLSQDPFLRPGDEIRLSSLKNLITIQGEVRRPGTYQLLAGEGLKELIEIYADGFTEKANTSRISLLHYLSDNSPVGEKLQFDYLKSPETKLRLYDLVNVPSLQELLPVVWFEGAVAVGSTGSSPETSQRMAYNFMPGETASQAALTNRKLFSAVSDLASSYIVHVDGSQTPINLAKFIYDYDLTNDVPLKANDTIIVPFRQFFVSVSGAVRYPGRYPYIPNRTWEYYIGLAGGFDTDRNTGQKIIIYDVNSQKVAIAERQIKPEDNIVAESNSFTYNMLRISGILSTVLSLAALIINLLNL